MGGHMHFVGQDVQIERGVTGCHLHPRNHFQEYLERLFLMNGKADRL